MQPINLGPNLLSTPNSHFLWLLGTQCKNKMLEKKEKFGLARLPDGKKRSVVFGGACGLHQHLPVHLRYLVLDPTPFIC